MSLVGQSRRRQSHHLVHCQRTTPGLPRTDTGHASRSEGESTEAGRFGHQVCAEGNVHVSIGKEVYFLGADGLLMPAKKDQPPPDLRYFKQYNR
jgi:hypothetical protein